LLAANDRADVAALAGVDVLHLGQGDLSTADARTVVGPDVLIGRSTRTVEQLHEADQDPGIDYFCTGPSWSTPTKPGRAALGWRPHTCCSAAPAARWSGCTRPTRIRAATTSARARSGPLRPSPAARPSGSSWPVPPRSAARTQAARARPATRVLSTPPAGSPSS